MPKLPSRRLTLAIFASLLAASTAFWGLTVGVTWLDEGGDSRRRGATGQARSGEAGESSQAAEQQSRRPSDAAPEIKRNPDGSYDIPNYVKVIVPEEISWGGPTCQPPKRGSLCEVTFQGTVYSKSEGAVLLLAFENDSEKEAASRSIPAVAGVNRINHTLSYLIGRDASKVTFLVVLRALDGAELAKNFPYTVPISK